MNLRLRAVLALFILCLTTQFTLASPVRASADVYCANTQSPFYRPVYPFFDRRGKRLVLIQQRTYKVAQTLETGIESMWFMGWSPNCRYYAAGIDSRGGIETLIWDVQENKRVGVFQRKAQGRTHQLFWEEEGRYVIVDTLGGQFLWNTATNQQILLTDSYCPFPHIAWDIPRQQVLVVGVDIHIMRCDSYHNDLGVTAYDLQTGKAAVFFANPTVGYLTSFELSKDKRLLTVTSAGGAVSVTWDRDTQRPISAKAVKTLSSDVALSPDQRFLAVRWNGWRSGGFDVKLYDLLKCLNKPCQTGLPDLDIPAGDYKWRFLDAMTIELTYKKAGTVRLFDLATNKFR